MVKIAVVGGGIFGCTAATFAARAGHKVHLYEQADSLLSGASQGNQYRLHKGFHYPRSPETALECLKGDISFRTEYSEAVIDGGRHYYAIATNGSKVTADEYIKFCEDLDLPFHVSSVGQYLNPESVDLVIEAEESRIDVERLRALVDSRMMMAGVEVHISQAFSPAMGFDYDRVIIAAYACSNACIAGLPGYDQCRLDQFQFEVVEKPVVQMPASFRNTGIVVMDGEFGCVDPIGQTGWHVLGHVSHSIWHRNIGLTADIPYPLVPYMDKGICTNPARTNVKEFIAAGSKYIPALEDAEYIGSMFTVRAVLPGKEATDERPTLVEVLGKDQRYIRVFSGKIGTAVEAAKQAAEML